MKKKTLSAVLISIILLTVFSPLHSNASNIKSSDSFIKIDNNYEDYTDNEGIIDITSNEEFMNHPAVGPIGDGSENNPYIIENWRAKQIIIKNVNCYFEIKNCFVYGPYGIYFYRTNNGKINNCTLESDNGYDGMRLVWSINNQVQNCQINNFRGGFYLTSYSTGNIVKNCEIYDPYHQSEGFVLIDSEQNTIADCHIKDFDTYAFRFENSNSNTIKQCIIEGSGWYGFDLQGSYSNTFYHNTILNEGDHVNSLGWTANNWDNGEQGNYWSSYNGDDKDKNGIGDNPYKKDNFPLIKFYGTPFPPTIRWSGNGDGLIGKAYDYFFKSTDQNNDMVYYHIDWDDGSPYELVGPYNSGEETPSADNIHIYKRPGDYNVRAQAIDTNGQESDWSFSFPVTMPRAKKLPFHYIKIIFEKMVFLKIFR